MQVPPCIYHHAYNALRQSLNRNPSSINIFISIKMIPAQKSVEWPWVSQCHDAPDWNCQFYYDSRAAPLPAVVVRIHVLCRYRSCIHTHILLCNIAYAVQSMYTDITPTLSPIFYPGNVPLLVIPVADSSVNRSLLAVEPFRDMGIIYSPLGQRNSVFFLNKNFPFSVRLVRSTGHLGSNGTHRHCCKRCRKLHMVA
jgi:hypothetical protein